MNNDENQIAGQVKIKADLAERRRQLEADEMTLALEQQSAQEKRQFAEFKRQQAETEKAELDKIALDKTPAPNDDFSEDDAKEAAKRERAKQLQAHIQNFKQYSVENTLDGIKISTPTCTIYDNGNNLLGEAEGNPVETAQIMLDVGKQKGWAQMSVSGNDDFMEAMAYEAGKRNVPVSVNEKETAPEDFVRQTKMLEGVAAKLKLQQLEKDNPSAPDLYQRLEQWTELAETQLRANKKRLENKIKELSAWNIDTTIIEKHLERVTGLPDAIKIIKEGVESGDIDYLPPTPDGILSKGEGEPIRALNTIDDIREEQEERMNKVREELQQEQLLQAGQQNGPASPSPS